MTTLHGTEDRPRFDFWATCPACRHTWIAYGPLPAPLETVANALRDARCPACGEGPDGLLCAKEADIQEAERKAGPRG